MRVTPLQLPAAAAIPSASVAAIIPLLALFYAALLPQEIRISVIGQNIYPDRFVAILLVPWLLYRIGRGHFPYRWWDAVFFVGAAWMIVSFAAVYDPLSGLRRGGALAIDTLVPYLVARLCLRDLTDLRRFLVLIAPGVLIAGMSMAIESVLQRPIVRPMFAEVFGRLPSYENGVATGVSDFITEVRLGFMRASGPFAHPILAGAFLASLIALYFSSALRGWPLYAGLLAAMCSVFSLSSAAYLALLVAVGLLAYDYLQRITTFLSWRIFLLTSGGLVTLAHLIADNGIVNVLIRYTLNPATGRYRMQIWEYGTASVEQHPIFGIGFQDYARLSWMVPSVDNHFLLLAIRHGLVTPICFILVSIAAVFMLSTKSLTVYEADRRLLVGVAIALSAMLIASVTVSFFGGTATWFYILLGLAISLSGRPALRA